MNKIITHVVEENKSKLFSKYGIYQVVKNKTTGEEISKMQLCLIPDYHLDPIQTGNDIIMALNKCEITPTIKEYL